MNTQAVELTITELKSQVERLREVLTSSYMTSDSQGGYHCAIDPLVKHLALKETPAQALNEIKAAAVERFKDELIKSVKVIFRPHIEGVCAVVIRQLREGE